MSGMRIETLKDAHSERDAYYEQLLGEQLQRAYEAGRQSVLKPALAWADSHAARACGESLRRLFEQFEDQMEERP